MVNEKILESISILLGIAIDYKDFDKEILPNIQMAFGNAWSASKLSGDVPIVSAKLKWSDLGLDTQTLIQLKQYTFIAVKELFDPPVSSTLASVMERRKMEAEFRMTIAAEVNDE